MHACHLGELAKWNQMVPGCRGEPNYLCTTLIIRNPAENYIQRLVMGACTEATGKEKWGGREVPLYVTVQTCWGKVGEACTDKNQLHAMAPFSPVFIPRETLQVLVVPGCWVRSGFCCLPCSWPVLVVKLLSLWHQGSAFPVCWTR